MGRLRSVSPEASFAAALLAILPLAFWTGIAEPFELVQALVLQVGLAGLGLLVAARFARGALPSFRPNALDAAVGAWAAWLACAVVLSPAPAIAFRGEFTNHDGAFVQIQYVLLYAGLRLGTAGPRAARRLGLGIAAGALGAATYVLLQAGGHDGVLWDAAFEPGRASGSLGNPLVAGAVFLLGLPFALAAWIGSDRSALVPESTWLAGTTALAAAGFGIACGLADHPAAASSRPASLAALVAGVAGLVLAAALARGPRSGVARVLFGLSAGVLLLRAMFETGSRSAVLGLVVVAAVGVGLSAALRGRRALTGASLAALLLGVVIAAGTSTVPRLAESAAAPGRAIAEARLPIWAAAWSMVRERPVVGWGPDTFFALFPEHEVMPPPKEALKDGAAQSAHNEPLQVLVTLGAVGLVLWCGLVVLAVRAYLVALRRVTDDATRWMLVGGAAAVAGYLVYASLGITSVPLRATFWALLALPSIALADPAPAPRGARRNTRIATVAIVGIAVAVWITDAATAFVAAERHRRSREAFHQAEALLLAGERGDPGAVADLAEARRALVSARPVRDATLESEAADIEQAAAWLAREVPRAPERASLLLPAAARVAALARLVVAAELQERVVGAFPREPYYAKFLGSVYARMALNAAPEGRGSIWLERADRALLGAAASSPLDVYMVAERAKLWGLRFEQTGDARAGALARELYAEATRRAPRTVGFGTDAAVLLLLLGREGEAFELLDRLRQLDPVLAKEVSVGAADALLSRGRAAAASGDAERSAILDRLAGALLARAETMAPGTSAPD